MVWYQSCYMDIRLLTDGECIGVKSGNARQHGSEGRISDCRSRSNSGGGRNIVGSSRLRSSEGRNRGGRTDCKRGRWWYSG